ncbi:MAG TPA: hypothetical protein VFO38_02755 [Candidatus Saccharimonadales bacterium]|nr:hypothetical protein [Candidatus Saccharimonadales bacterium]
MRFLLEPSMLWVALPLPVAMVVTMVCNYKRALVAVPYLAASLITGVVVFDMYLVAAGKPVLITGFLQEQSVLPATSIVVQTIAMWVTFTMGRDARGFWSLALIFYTMLVAHEQATMRQSWHSSWFTGFMAVLTLAACIVAAATWRSERKRRKQQTPQAS